MQEARIYNYVDVHIPTFGRKDSDTLRFENADIAGELLALTDESVLRTDDDFGRCGDAVDARIKPAHIPANALELLHRRCPRAFL